MGVRAPEEGSATQFSPRPPGPPVAAALALGVLVFLILVANGRPMPEIPGAYLGKALSALLSAAATVVLFQAMGRAHEASLARSCAMLFALGTPVWATSEGPGGQPFGVLGFSAALLFVLKAQDDEVWAGRVGLPLALAVAAWPANVAAAGILALGTCVRWPRRTLALIVWAAPGVAVFLLVRHLLPVGLPTGLEGLGGAALVGHAGLLVAPAKGLLVFTPLCAVAAFGMFRAWGWGERWLTGTLGAALLGEWAIVGATPGWHASPGFGAVALTSVLPLLFLFLPEGLQALPRLGALLAAWSVAAQVLGAFASDGRWERLYQSPAAPGHPEVWQVATSPLPFYVRRRVLILAMPEWSIHAPRVREYRLVVGGARGSRFAFLGDGVEVRGAEPNAGDIQLLGGARVEGERLHLHPGDGLFLRVSGNARLRPLQLRLRGQGNGTILVGESSFWSPPRFREYPLRGAFEVRHPYLFAESGGADLTVTLGRGSAWIASAALVAPSDAEHPLELP